MTLSIFERGQQLLAWYSSLQDKHETLVGMIRNEKALLSKAEKTHSLDLDRIAKLTQATEAMKRAIVPLTERGLRRMKDLISFGLLTIFPGCNYTLDIDIQERGNDKTAELWLLEGVGEDQTRCLLRDSIGGGLKSVVALIFRLFFILHYKQRRFMVMDEPFSDVATEYIPGLFKFIRYTVEDLGFRWLIVTHDTARFLKYGDHTYKMAKGAVTLVQKEGPAEDGAHA